MWLVERKRVIMDGEKKEQKETKKKKWKGFIGKLIAIVLIIGISVACSKYNFVSMGHNFFMRILSVATGQSQEEPENTLPPNMTTENENK